MVSSKGQLGQGLHFDVGAEANIDNTVRADRARAAEAIRGEFDRLGEQAEAEYFCGEVCGPKASTDCPSRGSTFSTCVSTAATPSGTR